MFARVVARPWFIPARAGNTFLPAVWNAATPVHPRACGEHDAVDSLEPGEDGSSPRVRGTRPDRLRTRRRTRFIPARAGNTRLTSSTDSPNPVHPRACGEHESAPRRPLANVGSSPRVRGTPRRRRRGRVGPPVHPRACGEHFRVRSGTARHTGSSPRVRGTPRPRGRRSRVYRFIPARAGNTLERSHRNHAGAVHPRACGEHRQNITAYSMSTGSSPRVRGTRYDAMDVRSARRFIPARAGNTVSVSPILLAKYGSSPRVRGTHAGGDDVHLAARFIPARAGNTVTCCT